jgi:hypothetical protein
MLQYIPKKIEVKYNGSTMEDQFAIYGGSSVAKKEIGWIPEIKLKDGLKKWRFGLIKYHNHESYRFREVITRSYYSIKPNKCINH